MFEPSPAVLVRAPAHRWPDVVRSPESTDEAGLVDFLCAPRDSRFDRALARSSPALAGTLRRVAEGVRLKPGELRGAALSLTRYQLRAAGRGTPFGLLAGVARLELAECTKVLTGSAHRPVSTVDLAWLIRQTRLLEARPEVRARLSVQANDLVRVRGDRAVLDGALDQDQVAGPRSVRATGPVRLALSLARIPLPYQELAAALLAGTPGATAEAVERLLAALVAQDFLLTALRPPVDHPDPLGHVRSLAPELPGPGTPTAVDLVLDAQGTLSAEVGAELARAAQALWRLAPADSWQPQLRAYHEAFLGRYGYTEAVPLLDLLDPERGLGAPAGYLHPASEREAPPRSTDDSREATLAELALAALAEGRDLVLDDALVARLATPATALPPHGFDLIAELVAPSARAVDDGAFRLVLTPWTGSQAPGSTFGRFGHLFEEDLLAAGPTAPDRITAHLVGAPLLVKHRPITRTRSWLADRLAPGSFGGNLELADLAVFADEHRLRICSLSRGQEVEFFAHHQLDSTLGVPNVARFVQEITGTGRRSFAPWLWGSLERLPALPRVRFGRVVLSPARWRCAAAELRDRSASWAQWDRDFATWRTRWSVPDRVLAGRTDKLLRLDLRNSWHRQVLRADLLDAGELVLELHEDLSAGGGAGWFDAGVEVAEVAVALRSTAVEPVAAVIPPLAPRVAPELPGGEWLYAKLYCAAAGQRELLAGPVARWVAELPPEVAEWFLLRFADPEPHLRLRLRGEPSALTGPVLASLRAWAGELIAAGLVRRFELSGYEPEVSRYGGVDLLPLAHHVFHTDSALALDILRRPGEVFTAAVAAADELVTALLSGTPLDPVEWVLSRIPHDEALHAGFRERREELLAADVPLSAARTEALRAYGGALHAAGPSLVDGVLLSLLHLHHNRLCGIDRAAERQVLAAVRGLARVRQGRRRVGR
ncbi:lantibiotic dehydratase [Crossiella sp. NPDC003009]